MQELNPNPSNEPQFPVQQVADKVYFPPLGSVPDIAPSVSDFSPGSKGTEQQAYMDMIQQVVALENAGNDKAAKVLRDKAIDFRDENGLEQVDESKMPGPDSTAATDLDKHAA